MVGNGDDLFGGRGSRFEFSDFDEEGEDFLEPLARLEFIHLSHSRGNGAFATAGVRFSGPRGDHGVEPLLQVRRKMTVLVEHVKNHVATDQPLLQGLFGLHRVVNRFVEVFPSVVERHRQMVLQLLSREKSPARTLRRGGANRHWQSAHD
jgi:hypothetical protein